MDAAFYLENSYKISELITKKYSTSFSIASSLLEKEKRNAIFAIYGFVRLADEIVDSFQSYDKSFLLNNFEEQLNYALENGISTNTILNSFVDTVKKFNIDKKHLDTFIQSMKFDLSKKDYTSKVDLDKYIHGSAEVVGLMCLKVFCNGNQMLYNQLEFSAQKLGSAFQKVNFLRDLNIDKNKLGRNYFPEISKNQFDKNIKRHIEQLIEKDFEEARTGISQLPGRTKFAVALAYYYYNTLLEKIKKTTPEKLLSKRVRISNFRKYIILLKVGMMYLTKII